MEQRPNKDQQIVFAVGQSPEDGTFNLLVGVTRDAWIHMRNGDTQQIDLTRLGIPVRLLMWGTKNRESAVRELSAAAKARGAPELKADLEQDYSTVSKFTDEEALHELARGSILGNLFKDVLKELPEGATRTRIEALLTPKPDDKRDLDS